jgi:hypothetical protein
MNEPSKINDCSCYYYYYDSTCLNGGRGMYCHEPSALACDSVHSFWQRGKFVTQHCDLRHKVFGRDDEMILPCWKNQPDGGQKPQCSFQCKDPSVPPTEADMETAEHRKYVIESKRKKKRKEQDLRVKILKKKMKKLLKFIRMDTSH